MEDLIDANHAKWKLLPFSFLATCCRACPKAAVVAALRHADGSEALTVFPEAPKANMKVVPI